MSAKLWKRKAFAALFADSFIEGTELEGDHIANGLATYVFALEQLLGNDEKRSILFSIFDEDHIESLDLIKKILEGAFEIAATATKVKKPDDLMSLVKTVVDAIAGIPEGKFILVPGGWVNNINIGWVGFIIERRSSTLFDLIVCNSGIGLDYHPSIAFESSKLKYKTAIRINSISKEKMEDVAWWTLAFSQWIKDPPSEYHRVEVLYDVLLPWMSGELLSMALAKTQNDLLSTWRTPSRSAASFIHSIRESIVYMLRNSNFTLHDIKKVSFILKRELVFQVIEDLITVKDPGHGLPDSVALATAFGSVKLINAANEEKGLEVLGGKTVAIYFSASWCPPCKKFSPILKNLYAKLKSEGKPFEVIYVSNDRDDGSFREYFGAMPWLAIPFSQSAVRQNLGQLFKIKGIPTLVIMGDNGKVLSMDGRQIVSEDPTGDHFPWTDSIGTISTTEAKLIQFGCKSFSSAGCKEHSSGRLDDEGINEVKSLIANIDEKIAELKIISDKPDSLPPRMDTELNASLVPYHNSDLLILDGMESYAGSSKEEPKPNLVNLLEVPEKVNSVSLAVAAMIRCDKICSSLLERARDGSSSSRLVLQYVIMELISDLFTKVIPLPLPMLSFEPGTDCIWKQSVTKDIQKRCLELIYKLTITYGTMWQAIESPTRAFDSERAVVAMAMLVLFDAAIRIKASDEVLHVSFLLSEDGGYALSNTVCTSNKDLEKASAKMELSAPHLNLARNTALDYFTSLNDICTHRLFEFRMPDKIEVRKYSSTCNFLLKLLDASGFELSSRDGPPGSEMETMMNWLFEPSSKLAQQQPEFGMMRDMVAMFKFLSTMETKDSELMRKQVNNNMEGRYVSWNISFDEDVSRGLANLRPTPLRWEVVNFRGHDLDIADIDAFGFGRRLRWGEGPVLQSPADLEVMLDIKKPSEDDILHADKLPSFNDTLSREEAEVLLSYITVDYIRIPLVLNFFASRDRVTYLFNAELQSLLRAVLFESAPWVPNRSKNSIAKVPVRTTTEQDKDARIERTFDARIPPIKQHLGTSYGLLINELANSPAATLEPFLVMMNAIKELGECSVYSADATFILYLLSLAITMEGYMVFILESPEELFYCDKELLAQNRAKLNSFLRTNASTILQRWKIEAEADQDVQTCVVVHSYFCLVWGNFLASELNEEILSNFMGSMAYVRNWHGFGMGSRRNADGHMLDPESRLLRFLQSQGIDTSRLAKGSLKKYLTDRPLYLKVGRDTVKIPAICTANTDAKLPPTDVPEYDLFAIMQLKRRVIISYMDNITSKSVDDVLSAVLRVAIKSPSFHQSGWKRLGMGTGKYYAESVEITVDTQIAEVLWRNTDMKPVPDSMTQYTDFNIIFGKESLHCGIVARQQKRLWVHIVGTECDLIEWTEPDKADQGVGAPLIIKDTTPAPTQGPYWNCGVCTYLNNKLEGQVDACGVCGSPNPASATAAQAGPPLNTDNGFNYCGLKYNRAFDPYSEDPHPHPTETWIVSLLGPLLNTLFPPDSEESKMKYKLMFPEKPYAKDAVQARLIGLEIPESDPDAATWREVVIYKNRKLVHMFNLLSHGRRMYRSLEYSSNSRFCLHSLPPDVNDKSSPVPRDIRFAAGSFKKLRSNEGSLVVLRDNIILGGKETYIPPRLLQGVIPTALLEAFRFWQGKDNLIRGEPVDKSSQFFNFNIEIILKNDSIADLTAATVYRRPLTAKWRVIQAPSTLTSEKSLVPTKSSSSANSDTDFIFDEMAVMQLASLGFGIEASKLALKNSGMDPQRAASWLFDDANLGLIASVESGEEENLGPLPLQRSTTTVAKTRFLEDKGFSQAAVEYALNIFNKDMVLAEAWLADASNAIEIARVEGSGVTAMEIDEEGVDLSNVLEKVELVRSISAVAQAGSTSADLILLNLLETPEDSAIFRLASALSRLEDLSHILVWATVRRSEIDESNIHHIYIVELPRLKIKFQPKLDSDGFVRLYMVDQAGWFVSEFNTTADEEKLQNIAPLLKGIDNCLVLEDQSKNLQVLVANHDCHRPNIAGIPWNCEVINDRTSLAWQNVMESRFYIYPIHTSKSFLQSPTLETTLYLILLRFCNRDYAGAFDLANTCSIDVAFTPEEKWIWSQLERCNNDAHPDAHALRLKLTLTVMYSKNDLPWKPHEEMNRYLAKFSHISSYCKLSLEEELEAIYQCKQVTPRIKNRLSFLEAAKNGGASVTMKGAPILNGGQPWMKLNLLSLGYLEEYGQSVTKIHYKRPPSGAMSGKDAVDVIWEDFLIMDNESGGNRQLGWIFLFELISGSLSFNLIGKECGKSMGELLLKYFHLKCMRWGKETTDQGEIEAGNSKNLHQLAMMLMHGSQHWPNSPRDPDTIRQMNAGVNLYSAQGRQSLLFNFMQFLEMEWKAIMKGEAHDKKVAEMQGIYNSLKEIKLSGEIAVPAISIELLYAPSIQEASNTSCSSRKLDVLVCPDAPALNLTKNDIACFVSQPLSPIDLSKFVVEEKSKEIVSNVLPFTVNDHPSAKTVVAQDMLQRLEKDLNYFANKKNSQQITRLMHATSADIERYSKYPGGVNKIVDLMFELTESLEFLQASDSKYITKASSIIVQVANTISSSDSLDIPRTLFWLRRYSDRELKIDISFITSALLSDVYNEDLKRLNPFLKKEEEIKNIIGALLFHTCRMFQANRAIALAASVKDICERLLKVDASDSVKLKDLCYRLQHETESLAIVLATKRSFVKPDWTYDPRFLVFEYIFNIMLRPRQVEMVEWFIESLKNGDSRVQQMIMGAGKTTTVGPLLTLILADGKSLVTQVMPTALLEQTRNIMRKCFSNIITKRVYTLEFDRQCEDSVEIIAEVFAKLDSARRHRSVIVAAPECVKSLMLKFIEQLHSIRHLDISTLAPSESSRHNKEIVRLRDQMISRSSMADAIVKVLDMWQNGVLIMDEVDVLLHPLRSELNFPIGHKNPIDLSGFRWELPIHLIDAVFTATSGKKGVFESVNKVTIEKTGLNPEAILNELLSAINDGYACHALQRNPHLVLLDNAYYEARIKLVMAKWALFWLRDNLVGEINVSNDIIIQYIQGIKIESIRDIVEKGLLSESKKLLNLTSDWINMLLPHVLSKIDRVSFGILSPQDLALADARMPMSRKVMAVPFVGKDVPSRSSEFAHPDVLIGLTILAYRYEGVRLLDLKRVVLQLKQDYSRQIGPRADRPACKLFKAWLMKTDHVGDTLPVLPLPLFQPNDSRQLFRLFTLVRKLPDLVHYYLRQHVFPATMNFQSLKISACGHELGSSELFGRRIGFSGTPSNLLPVDLGECMYEPGSDGEIITCLTSPQVVSSSIKHNWTARSLLRDVATADPPFHALIDTGALITGMDNDEVAKYLLQFLPEWMEGVVYLDKQDRKLVLLRNSERSVNIAQCGIAADRRFTFYDQVHTTGMDIKQSQSARAVVTLGKDMTFRDYAQGSYRMRGIGKGQTIHLFVIPEVENRIKQDLTVHSKFLETNVPAWLLINSMKMESLQSVQLSIQELNNVWRKRGLYALMDEVRLNKNQPPVTRLRRFDGDSEDQQWLKNCMGLFREEISFEIKNCVPTPTTFADKLKELVSNKLMFMKSDAEKCRVNDVVSKVQATTEMANNSEMNLNSEVVHEQEAEAEEEAEQEAEQEEQKVSAFTRDDEQSNPWKVEILEINPNFVIGGEDPFYRFKDFSTRDGIPRLDFPENLSLSDNFFRPTWYGMGDRRLKNVGLVLEWTPTASSDQFKAFFAALVRQYTTGCQKMGCENSHCVSSNLRAPFSDPTSAAAEVLKILAPTFGGKVSSTLELICPNLVPENIGNRFIVAVSLAEGETLRRILHTNQQTVCSKSAFALRTVDGNMIDASPRFMQDSSIEKKIKIGMQCLKFFNCDMYYSDEELSCLLQGLKTTPIENRLTFFSECLRLRRKERNLWGDTPLAKVFTIEEEWHLLASRSKIQLVNRIIKTKKIDPSEVFERFDLDHDGVISYKELQEALESMKLNLSPKDLYEIVRITDKNNDGVISYEEYISTFPVPEDLFPIIPPELTTKASMSRRWQCQNCTFVNSIDDLTCAMCEMGWSGRREVPPNKWMCNPEDGGCTYFNPNTSFYCSICNRSRPDLSSVRF